MKNIAIIPARSGSKGVKNKNIRLLNGIPLMGYTISSAIQSECFDEVMVSTDSVEYAKIAERYGAAVPFLRTESTSSDTASTWDTAEEVLEEYRKNGRYFDTFCILQPTSPLRKSDDIIQAFKIYEEKATFNCPRCSILNRHSPLWSGQLPDNNEFIDFIDFENMKQRQAGGKFYRLNGAIYIVNYDRFKKDRYLYQKGSFAYIMPQERSVDIDSEIDFEYAELLIKKYGENNV